MQRPGGQMQEMPEFPDGERPELPEGEDGERPEFPDGAKGGRGGFGKGIDTDAISEAIEALSDDETKENLEALLADYEEAKSAVETAIENEDEDIDSYREAEMTAMKALFDALEDAGIDTKPEIPEDEDGTFREDEASERRESFQDKETLPEQNDRAAGQTDKEAHSEETPANTESVITKIANWFRSFFSK